MKPALLKLVCGMALSAVLLATPGRAADPAPAARVVRFAYVDVYLDAGAKPLAAYQVELTPTAGDVVLTGLEGGEHAAFRDAPYYDPAALHAAKGRVIVAAFNTGADLPRGLEAQGAPFAVSPRIVGPRLLLSRGHPRNP